jgi:hypothetical protein
MTEQENIQQLIQSKQPEMVELAVMLAFSLNIDLGWAPLLELCHQLQPAQLYEKDKKKKLTQLLCLQKIVLTDIFPDNLSLLPNLRMLSFEGFSHFRLSIKKLHKIKQLEELNLHGIQLQDLGYGFQELGLFKKIRFSFCRFDSIHKDFYRLKQLEEIDFNGSAIAAFIRDLSKISTLRVLRISKQPIEEETLRLLGEMTALESLELYETQIKNTSLKRLRRLLKNCQIQVLG